MSKLKVLLFATAVAFFAVAIQLQSAPPVAAATASVEVSGVTSFAARQLNKPFKLGTDGMRRYDCSGLVYRTFMENGLAAKIGGQRTALAATTTGSSARGLASRSNPHVGDLVVWANRGHAGQPHRHLRRLQPVGCTDGHQCTD